MNGIDIVGVEKVPIDKSLKINGPPGTGKTTQGIARVVDLIETHGYTVQDIAWATYRRSLAEDVLDRLVDAEVLTDDDMEKPWLGRTEYFSTVHAIARRIAERNEIRQWNAPRWHDKQDFMLSQYSLPFESNSNNSPDYGALLFGVYQWLVNNNLPMDAAHQCPRFDELQSEWSSHSSLNQFEGEWEDYKQENNIVDFHEYLTHVRDGGIAPPVDVVVIDEYHDAYPLLDDVCRMWIDAAEVAIVLGDPQQVVNVHEGATPKLFEDLAHPEVQLDKTWRVPPVLWGAAADVLAGYHEPHEPELNEDVVGDLYEVRPPQIDYNNDTDEWMTPSREYGTPDDLVERFDDSMLFLARTRRMVKGITQAFLDEGLLFRSQVGNGWRSNDRRRHVYNALQRLRGVDVEMGGWHEYEVVWSDDAGSADEEPPQEMHSYEMGHLLQQTPAKFLRLSRGEIDAVAANLLDSAKCVSITRLGTLVTDEFWTEMTGGAGSVHHLVHRQGDRALEHQVIEAALNYNEGPTIEVAPDTLHDDGLDDAPDARTIHASKGSEATVAVVYDGITSTISQGIRRDPTVAANEDRVWYVGLTRAMQSVVVCRDVWWWADEYLPWTISDRTTNASLPSKKGDSQ
ncbi:UvrD-helicase domain-containing protein [Candidatus Halobonum tyrrellensis]|uniref:DNA/RNA helicase, superfamily I n=1 Tax=Candidatus Halobonum tyrrellensis G22 TaxID=1324957 RepID=V4HFQ4_9EURY|nr:UvrD-helicase domain-containing protein [Candidatus Halobonum tyrrellensis]ESP88918.1 DNA/RNA helicase, superfamily I [Candidatus Halobonum tyrrellensis G22]